jgi:lipopolysaccharide biosynthesis glycosyltransferase
MANVLDHAVTQTVRLGRGLEEKSFHIAFTGTTNYISHMGIVALSIRKWNPDMPISFHFFVNSLPDEERSRLIELSRLTKAAVYVHLIDDSCFKTLLLSDGVAAFFYRFVVAPTLAHMTDRVLYLDGDMMCRGDISYLRDLDFKGMAAAVVTDRREESNARRVGTAHYFNAGMMLINVDVWMKENLFDDIVSRAEENVARVGNRLSHHDQDIHNQMLDGRVLYVPRRYNYLYNLDRQSLFAHQPINADYKDQVIIHFAGHAKPWHSWVQEWPVVREYAEIQKNSPWKDVPLVPPKGRKNLHQAARTARMEHRFGDMVKWYVKYIQEKI